MGVNLTEVYDKASKVVGRLARRNAGYARYREDLIQEVVIESWLTGKNPNRFTAWHACDKLFKQVSSARKGEGEAHRIETPMDGSTALHLMDARHSDASLESSVAAVQFLGVCWPLLPEGARAALASRLRGDVTTASQRQHLYTSRKTLKAVWLGLWDGKTR